MNDLASGCDLRHASQCLSADDEYAVVDIGVSRISVMAIVKRTEAVIIAGVAVVPVGVVGEGGRVDEMALGKALDEAFAEVERVAGFHIDLLNVVFSGDFVRSDSGEAEVSVSGLDGRVSELDLTTARILAKAQPLESGRCILH